jgi:hypothetical protein
MPSVKRRRSVRSGPGVRRVEEEEEGVGGMAMEVVEGAVARIEEEEDITGKPLKKPTFNSSRQSMTSSNSRR